MSRRMITFGFLAVSTALSLAVAAPVAFAGPSGVSAITNSASSGAVAAPATGQGVAGVDAAKAFPSATSTVVGSVGFIDSSQVGYFWSASRGDSVTETLSGPAKIKKAIFKLDVISNALNSGAHVDWIVSINGTDVGSFNIVEGQLGAVTEKISFPKITGGSYTVKIRVNNEVAGGEGSHTLRYAGAGPHSVTLKKK